MGSNTEKKPWTNLKKLIQKIKQRDKSDNFCYCKVGGAITKWGAIKTLFRIMIVAIIFSPTVITS